MTHQLSSRHGAGTAAELYDRTFVPSIAAPVSGPLLEMARLQPGERALDLACGTGLVARLAAEQVAPGGSVVGVDVSPDMIGVARAKPAPAGVEVGWREADAAALPLGGDAFDVVLCQMGLMFFEDKAAALAEVRRVLRSGGRLVLSTPGALQPPLEILDRALVEHVHPDLGGFVRAVFSLHDPEAVAGLLRDAGFEAVDATSSVVPLDLPTPAEFLWQYVGSTPLGPVVDAAPGDARTALEDDIVARWQPFVDDEGRLAVRQPMVYAGGTSR
jgi:ubiquinone/menaquinone biosynthesis C-methylase UbiE